MHFNWKINFSGRAGLASGLPNFDQASQARPEAQPSPAFEQLYLRQAYKARTIVGILVLGLENKDLGNQY